MTTERNRIDWVFWFVWVLITTMGWLIGFFIGFILADIIAEADIGSSVLGEILTEFTFGAGLGAFVGFMQLLILRAYVSRTGWWVLASAVSLAVVMGAGIAVETSEGLGSLAALFNWNVIVALGGAVMGTLQWLVLRGQVSRAGWWVLASTVGWWLSMAVVGAFSGGGVGSFSTAPLGGAVLGAVTGGPLAWLLRQPVSEA